MAKTGSKAAFPGFIPPALATTKDTPPSGPARVHELKLDGYRLQAHIQSGQVRLFTRTGLDWTARFRGTPSALRALPVKSAIIDGEVTAQDATGVPRLSALQEALSIGRGPFIFYVFDLLYLDGRDLRTLPLVERKALLAPIVADAGLVQYSEDFDDGAALFQAARSIGAEGVLSKRRDAPYPAGRNKVWMKAKHEIATRYLLRRPRGPTGTPKWIRLTGADLLF